MDVSFALTSISSLKQWSSGCSVKLSEDALPRFLINGYVLRKREDHSLMLRPVVVQDDCLDGSFSMQDETTLFDILYARFPCVGNGAHFLWFGTCLLTPLTHWPVNLIFLPTAILVYTGSSVQLWPEEIPWAQTWEDVCLAVHDIICVVLLYHFCFQISMIHSGMFRLLLRRQWPRILLTVGSAWFYSISACLLQARVHHSLVLWLLLNKFAIPLVLCIREAITANILLRMPEESLKDFIVISSDTQGRARTRNGKVVVWSTTNSVLLAFLDIIRHYLLVFMTEPRTIWNFNFANPYTNELVSITAHDLATSLYWTSLVFFVQCNLDVLQSSPAQTCLLCTPFSMSVIRPADATGQQTGTVVNLPACEVDVSLNLDEVLVGGNEAQKSTHPSHKLKL